MALEEFSKQPNEKFMIWGDITDVIESGDSIKAASSSLTAVTSIGTDVTATVIDSTAATASGYKFGSRVQAGTEAQSPYQITFNIYTTNGDKFEIDVKMKIEDL